MTIESDVHTALSNAGITNMNREATQSDRPPYVVFSRVSTMSHDTINGAATIDQARIQLNCYADRHALTEFGASVKAAVISYFGPKAVQLHYSVATDGESRWVWFDYSIWKKIT
jgi:hypothetical protein